jgi:hypothetical protein
VSEKRSKIRPSTYDPLNGKVHPGASKTLALKNQIAGERESRGSSKELDPQNPQIQSYSTADAPTDQADGRVLRVGKNRAVSLQPGEVGLRPSRASRPNTHRWFLRSMDGLDEEAR